MLIGNIQAAWEELNGKTAGGQKKRKVDATASKEDDWEDETINGISEAEIGIPVIIDSVQIVQSDVGVDEDKSQMDEIL